MARGRGRGQALVHCSCTEVSNVKTKYGVVHPEAPPDTQRPRRACSWCDLALLCLSFPMCQMELMMPTSRVHGDS